ncbi:MAG: hypothetical protein MUC31_04505, partial [Bacteroidales bacterium]|nr:hypothetical protein [Bacteroidales bacterium]
RRQRGGRENQGSIDIPALSSIGLRKKNILSSEGRGDGDLLQDARIRNNHTRVMIRFIGINVW